MEKEDGSAKHSVQDGEDSKQGRILQSEIRNITITIIIIMIVTIIVIIIVQNIIFRVTSIIIITMVHGHRSNLFKDSHSAGDEACKDKGQDEEQGPLADLGGHLVHLPNIMMVTSLKSEGNPV